MSTRQAIGWMLGSVFCGCSIDAVTKSLSNAGVGSEFITTARFIIASLLALVPLIVGGNLFPNHPILMLLRSACLCVGIQLWAAGIGEAEMAVAGIYGALSPCIQIFLAWLFLREKLTFPRIGSTVLSFAGAVVASYTGTSELSQARRESYFRFSLASLSFAVLGCLNKYNSNLRDGDGPLCDVFWCNLVTAILSVCTSAVRQPAWPSRWTQWAWLIVLGILANGMIYMGHRAWSMADLSATAALEFVGTVVFSALIGFIVFSERPTKYVLIGAVLVLLATAWITASEQRSRQKKKSHSS